MGWINKMKDASLAKMIVFWANRRKRYGVMLNLNLDSKQRILKADILPKGETDSIRIFAQYKFHQEPEGSILLKLSDVHASREWIDIYFQEVNQREVTVPVPQKFGQFLRFAL